MSKPQPQVETAVPVAVPYVVFEVATPQADPNGILEGQWKAGICDCCSDLVPNCCMAYWCPCVSLGQTMARVEASGTTYMVIYGLLYLVYLGMSFSSAAEGNGWFSRNDYYNRYNYHESHFTWKSYVQCTAFVISTIVLMAARSSVRSRFNIAGDGCTDCICSCCCSCCVIAQMATHVEAYTPGQCDFGFKDTLPAYQPAA
ncbi:unnamed protein product [Aphanomyces euteiches]|uniref:PLAC8 family protein n=1 Tax=Aphanomyces euteiches TaxID=100861 RepID=A0A6G0XDT7_9STRA|nr:hypothetical protein Ae201684_006192 [Aphanomyces euteiches]KAH9068518.1 hypothetical protein Ae201684P_004225 [Aphanomyces euteiches]KAH9145846.1 hypothetical protein AeRB84_010240 [Aphanomyces euteiches]